MICQFIFVLGLLGKKVTSLSKVQMMSRDSIMEQMAEYEQQLADYDINMDDVKRMKAAAGGAEHAEAFDRPSEDL